MSETKYQRIISMVLETPWAILPQKLVVIQELLAYRSAGYRFTDEEIRERLQAENTRTSAANGNGRSIPVSNVAIIPILGTIIPRANMFSDFSGGASITRLTRAFRAALADEDVSHIIFDVDSPGGAVSGVDELATEIFKARGQKPITAVANHFAASAAYWLASAADELVVTPTSEVGSIGVFAAHHDYSEMLNNEGIKINLIAAGKYKVEMNPYEPLSEEARAAIQYRVDDYYNMFTTAVAKHRGVKRSDVTKGFGQGRVVGAKDAVKMGMADRIATLDETIQQIQKGGKRRRSASADLEFRRRRLRAAAQ